MSAIVIGTLALIAMSQKDESSGGSGQNPYSEQAWRRFDALFKKYASIHGVDWHDLKAIALNESSLGTHPSVDRGLREPSNVEGSKSYDGKSWGLMQVTLTTARDMDPQATAAKLNDAEYSISLGARYVSRLQKMFSPTDPRFKEWVIKGYNQGPGNSLKERAGTIKGYAAEYWERYQRNIKRVKERP